MKGIVCDMLVLRYLGIISPSVSLGVGQSLSLKLELGGRAQEFSMKGVSFFWP